MPWIGYVPQKSSSDPMATGMENLVLGGRIYGLSRTDAVRGPPNCSSGSA